VRDDIDYSQYDTTRFVQDHPGDQRAWEALTSARELAADLSPRLPDETLVDARHRVDQTFHQFSEDTGRDLDNFHQGETSGMRDEFRRNKEAEIYAKHRAGIDATPRREEKFGGQNAFNSERDQFRQDLPSNPEFKHKDEQLAHMQGARTEAISHGIEEIHQQYLKDHDMEDERVYGREELEPGREPFADTAEPARREAEQWSAGDAELKFKPLPGETPEQAATRAAEAAGRLPEQKPDDFGFSR